MKLKFAIGLLVAMHLSCQAFAQPAEIIAIDEATVKALKHLTVNSRYTFTENSYGDMEFGKRAGHATETVIFGETTGVSLSSSVWYAPRSEKKYGRWVDGNQLVFTAPGETGGTVIHRQHAAWASDSDAGHFAVFYANMGLGHLFLRSSGRKYGLSRNPQSFPVKVSDTSPTITEVVHRNRPCYKVSSTSDGGRFKPVTTDYHIDKQTGMVLSVRQSGTLHIPKGGSAMLLDVAQETEITYGPPTENGLPFPVSVKGWYVWPTGRKEPMLDIVYTDFRRYQPSADELDFEKQFGIPLPALPPKPTASSGSTLGGIGGGGRTKWWLLGAFAVVSLTAAAVYLRRRRMARVST